MQLTDYLVDYSLQINSQCLQALLDRGRCLSHAATAHMILNVEQSQGLWRLVKSQVGTGLVKEAEQRLGIAQRELDRLPSHHRLLKCIHKLLKKNPARSEKIGVREAFEVALLEFTVAPYPTAPDGQELSGIFQEESRSWRELSFPMDSDDVVVELGFGKVYRNGRRLGQRALEDRGRLRKLFAKWRRWARLNMSQLEIIRPALSERNQAKKWYLDRLVNSLGQFETLSTLKELLGNREQNAAVRRRLQLLLQQRLDRQQQRILKLYPYIYGQKVEDYHTGVRADIKNLGLQNVIMLPTGSRVPGDRTGNRV